MSLILTSEDLRLLVQRVFQPSSDDRGLAIMVDLPDNHLPDNDHWARRREMALAWFEALQTEKANLDLEKITLAWYPNAGGNNADLPSSWFPGHPGEVLNHVDDLRGPSFPFSELFANHSLILAPTELSTTAPLKVAARAAGSGKTGFRAATMPGFLPEMIPALRLDYGLINRRVEHLKTLLDQATRADFRFQVDDREYNLKLDLRHNPGHASGGLFPHNGIAGNLPSGEAYTVPYEGNLPGDPSLSEGLLPVQIDEEVVIYRIAANKAVEVLSKGPVSRREARSIREEPAYANLAELGLGVLGDFHLKPTGSILLDEKLGLHIAFGRSDHFGGSVGPQDFSQPEAVIHLDRVYIPETQDRVLVREVKLTGPQLEQVILRDGVFLELA